MNDVVWPAGMGKTKLNGIQGVHVLSSHDSVSLAGHFEARTLSQQKVVKHLVVSIIKAFEVETNNYAPFQTIYSPIAIILRLA